MSDPSGQGLRSLAAIRYASLLLPLVGGLAWGIYAFQDEQGAAVERVASNAMLVRQYAERLIETQTILQDAAQKRAADGGAGFLRSEPFHNFLQAIEEERRFTLGLVVLALDGEVVASSRNFPVNARFEDRDYLAAIAQGETLHLDRIRLQPSDQDALVVVTPFVVEGFSGAIVSAVAIEAVREFLQGIAAGTGESASLLRGDGKLLVRSIPSDPIMLDPASPARLAIASGDAGIYRAVALSDGVDRLYAFDRLAGVSVYAHFGFPRTGIFTGWLSKIAPVWLLLAAFGIFSFLMAGQARQSMAIRIAATENARRLEEAEKLAEQRVRLMQEMNHRVKNNLALIVSLIGMQMREKGAVDGTDLKARVHAISEVHDLMYQSADGINVDFGQILRKLASSPAVVPAESGIVVVADEIEKGVLLGPDLATPLALITAELMTNAVKHAFPGRDDGRIALSLRRNGGEVVLDIGDDGIGLPQAPARNSGMAIVEAFVDQVGGRIERCAQSGAGARFRITLAPGQQFAKSVAPHATATAA